METRGRSARNVRLERAARPQALCESGVLMPHQTPFALIRYRADSLVASSLDRWLESGLLRKPREGPRVRRLAGGGKRIRTVGPSTPGSAQSSRLMHAKRCDDIVRANSGTAAVQLDLFFRGGIGCASQILSGNRVPNMGKLGPGGFCDRWLIPS